MNVGGAVGKNVRGCVGVIDGNGDGPLEGVPVGATDGDEDGLVEGDTLGVADGLEDGGDDGL